MAFLDWWKDNKEEESASQLDLLESAKELAPQRKRVDGATVYRRFTQKIKDAGGSDRVYAKTVRAETEALFDCNVEQLYKETGGKQGDRSTLPVEAQEAYIVSEALSTHELAAKQIASSPQSQKVVDQQIVQTVKETATEIRDRWLPW